MMLYKIMLALFVFGAVVSGLNSSHIFSYNLPEASGATITSGQVVDLTNATQSQSMGPFTIMSMTFMFIGMIFQGIQAVAFIAPLLAAYNMPLYIIGMIQIPIWLIEIWGVYELVTGNTQVES